MNLFILSLNFVECARYMFDKHISKIILEAAQMLCMAYRIHAAIADADAPGGIYRMSKSHRSHPVTLWMCASYENVVWTLDLVDAMHEEWKYRYDHPVDKEHKSYVVCKWIREHMADMTTLPKIGLTPFAQAMPDEYRDTDAITAYRNYYQSPEKARIATWKKREQPEWYMRSIIKQ